jgi:hypothetical protein
MYILEVTDSNLNGVLIVLAEIVVFLSLPGQFLAISVVSM